MAAPVGNDAPREGEKREEDDTQREEDKAQREGLPELSEADEGEEEEAQREVDEDQEEGVEELRVWDDSPRDLDEPPGRGDVYRGELGHQPGSCGYMSERERRAWERRNLREREREERERGEREEEVERQSEEEGARQRLEERGQRQRLEERQREREASERQRGEREKEEREKERERRREEWERGREDREKEDREKEERYSERKELDRREADLAGSLFWADEQPDVMQQEWAIKEISRIAEIQCELWEDLKNCTLSELRRIFKNCFAGDMFSTACQSDSDGRTASLSLLEKYIQVEDPLHILQKNWRYLQQLLYSSGERATILFLTLVGRVVEDPEALTEFLTRPQLLRGVIRIAVEKTAVAKEAIASLLRIAQTPHGLEALLTGNLLAELKSLMVRSDTIRYRVYELITNISSMSADSLNYCVNSGLISDLIWDVTRNDVKSRAICIEMVTSLVRTPHGRHYLTQEGIIDKVSDIIIEAESDPFSGFYLPGFVKFFATLAVVDNPQQVCERYPVFVEKVFSMAEGQDLFGAAVDTLSIMGSNVEGKIALQKMGSRLQCVLKRMGSELESAPTELRVQCLDAIASLLYLPSDQQTEDLLQMTEYWFSCLSEQPLELLQSINTQTFPDLHCGALRVLTAIANQPWAQQMMVASPSFVEYIMDRSEEPDKVSKEAKYELVKALANSETTAQIFGNQYYLRLQEYLRDESSYVMAIATTSTKWAESDSPSTSGNSGNC